MHAVLSAADEARAHLAERGWIPPRAEHFRHLPPPPAPVWLGDGQAAGAVTAGWQLRELADSAHSRVHVRWFDAADPVQRAALFAALPAPGEDEAAPFGWAHRALLRHALRLRVERADDDGAPTLLHVEHRAGASVEAPLLMLELRAGARCVLLETHPREHGAPLVQNLQVHVRLGEGANLQHLRVVLPAAGDRIAHHVQVHARRDAAYAQCLLGTGARYHLQRNAFELSGPGARATSAGVLLGAAGALEQQVRVDHAAARTTSSVNILALPGAAAHMVANAHTRIAAGCSDAQVRQRLCGIPVAGSPRIVLRPHLEIHHDQVQAAHGATWGALPEEALFHARQRGLDEDSAKALILAGLARATFAGVIDDDALPSGLRLDTPLAAALAQALGSARPAAEACHG